MIRHAFAITVLALCPTLFSVKTSAQCCHATRDSIGQNGLYAPSTLIIWYDASHKSNKRRLMKAVRAYKATLLYDYRIFNGIAIKIPDGGDIQDAINYFKNVKGVLSVNRDRIMHLD